MRWRCLRDSAPSTRPDWLGGLVGILTFLGGIVLLLLTFRLAFEMFSIPPERALNVNRETPVDLARTGETFVGIIGRILLLLVMAAVGSIIANRGIKLYAESRVHPMPPAPPKGERAPQTESVPTA